jgi:hypothetical protein
MALVVIVIVGGSLGLNRASGDSWGRAFLWAGIAIGLGVLVGGGYFLVRYFAKPS